MKINFVLKETHSTNLYERIKHVTIKIGLGTSCNGLPNLISTSRLVLKCIWTFFILISTCGCVWMVMKNVSDYLQYDVITKFETIIRNEIVFPSLTICAKSDDIRVEKCWFNSNYNCMYDYERIVFLDRFCILFNGGKNVSNHSVAPLKSQATGYYNGIQLNLRLYRNQWVSIYVGEQSIPPTIYEMQSVYLDVGVEADMILKKVISKNLGEPYNECLEDTSSLAAFDSVPYKEIIKSNKIYRKDFCVMLCGFMNYGDSHECSFPGVYKNQNFSQKCLTYYENIIINISQYKLDCEKACPQECTSISYDNTIRQVALPQDYSYNQLNIFAYFTDFRYTQVSQIAKSTLPDLIATAGGTMGLFLGVSLLSFVEILHLVVEILYLVNESNKIA